MSEFFNDSIETPVETQEAIPEVEKIKVGEEEYTPEELSNYIKLGKIGRDLEEQWNTKIDKVYPEYTKATTKLKEYEEKFARQEAEKNALPPETEMSNAQVRQKAREVGIVTKDDINDFISEAVKQQLEEDKRTQSILRQADKFEREIDGSDGRPKFETEQVLKYMAETGVVDMKVAYELVNRDSLDSWRLSQLEKNKPRGMMTQPSGGQKSPEEPKITKDNIDAMVREALNIEG